MKQPFLPLVGIQTDTFIHLSSPFQGTGEKYIAAVAHGSGGLPVLLPALGAGEDLDSLLEQIKPKDLVRRLDGLLLPGSLSNMEPQHYGGEPSLPGTLHDSQRDESSLLLIQAALEEGVPLLAICRGFQELNVALGGTLHQRVHELPGMMDHRELSGVPRDKMYGEVHSIELTPGGLLSELTGEKEVNINSLHGQGIARLAKGLTVEARAPDGLVEAVRVTNADNFALGVQWHPEWNFSESALSRVIFSAFGKAMEKRAHQRLS